MQQDRIDEWRRWSSLAWYDILARYRRTFFGPFWIVLITSFTVLAIGYVYGALFKIDLKQFFPYVTVGLIVWMWISATITECCSAYISYRMILLNYLVSSEAIIIRIVARNFYIFLHNMVIIIAVLAIIGFPSFLGIVKFILSIGLVTLLLFPIGIIVALICSRFRDLVPLIGSIFNMLFLITPIIWTTETLGSRAYIANLNPFTHVLNVIRNPLLSQEVPYISWYVVIGLFIISSIIAININRLYQHRMIFWI